MAVGLKNMLWSLRDPGPDQRQRKAGCGGAQSLAAEDMCGTWSCHRPSYCLGFHSGIEWIDCILKGIGWLSHTRKAEDLVVAHKTGYLSSSYLALKAYRIPRELLVYRLCWNPQQI